MNKEYRPKGWTKEMEAEYQRMLPDAVGIEIDWYDKEGHVIPWLMGSVLKVYVDYYRIGSDCVGDFWVSTVWLGLDHNYKRFFDKTADPIIFETMVFPLNKGKISYADQEMERYSTEKEAIAGHKAMVGKYKLFEKTMKNKVPRYEGYNK